MNYSGAEIRSWRVQSRSPLEHRTCPVNYSEAPLKIPEGEEFGLEFPGAPDSPVRQTRVPSVVLLLFLLNPFLGLFIVLL